MRGDGVVNPAGELLREEKQLTERFGERLVEDIARAVEELGNGLEVGECA